MISLIQNRVLRLSRQASFVAIFSLFFMTVGDAHAHLCLDGQEPAVSLHFENLDGHPNHSEDEEAHNDYEYEIDTQILQTKSNKTSNALDELNYGDLLGSSLGINLALRSHSNVGISASNSFFKPKPSTLLPPLRAPPVIV